MPKRSGRRLTRSEMMARVRSSDTAPEMTVRCALWRAGLRYRLHDKSLPGRPDIVFRSRRIAVFVHGCFWHRHAGCRLASTPKTRPEFWEAKFRENVTRDARVVAELEAAGWRPIVMWGCAVADPTTLTALATLIRNTESRSE